ncbi:MAG: D-glycero-D-manno-heptose 1-phosphate guanosyltransferase [uncultured Sulfurovum sp.]|uniref:D-glycero-D-manno-heptose 1-phosphate guanosyltransferase n=1 Tax=uncultured Sulfurovum sp. TaxID=269237 RepID=A0A6S6SSB0_9BACT|nr:MAG: D-glycero-D-manno-heptose 1-phosphate guanosyltransferase [uncultured Sulfurovum sp.]
MEAIILAGGLGTRLKSVVSDLPKPMAPIEEKPFLEYILHYLLKNKITRVILSVGYQWQSIKSYFGNNFREIELIYSIENEPLGTGGAIKKALEKINNQQCFILNGDTFFNVDLQTLTLPSNSKIILSLKKMHHFDRYGCVENNTQQKVSSFTEKVYRTEGNINGGVYLVNKNIFNDFDLESKFSFEAFMQENFKKLGISVKIFEDYFIDIGIPDDYAKAQNEIKLQL